MSLAEQSFLTNIFAITAIFFSLFFVNSLLAQNSHSISLFTSSFSFNLLDEVENQRPDISRTTLESGWGIGGEFNYQYSHDIGKNYNVNMGVALGYSEIRVKYFIPVGPFGESFFNETSAGFGYSQLSLGMGKAFRLKSRSAIIPSVKLLMFKPLNIVTSLEVTTILDDGSEFKKFEHNDNINENSRTYFVPRFGFDYFWRLNDKHLVGAGIYYVYSPYPLGHGSYEILANHNDLVSGRTETSMSHWGVGLSWSFSKQQE